MSYVKEQEKLFKQWKKMEAWKAICIEMTGEQHRALLNKELQREWAPLVNRAANKMYTIARRLVPRDTRALWRSIKKFHADNKHQKGYRGLQNTGWFQKKSAVIVMLSYKDKPGTLKTLAVERGRRPPEAGGYRRMDKQPFIGPAQKEVRSYFAEQFRIKTNAAIKKAYEKSKSVPDKRER